MSYRLTLDETVSRGLKRIAREEIDYAIAQLSAREGAKRDAAIHEARKSIKKLRGLLRMLEPALGPSAEADIESLGALGRTLSAYRDAAAMLETVDLIAHHCRGDQAIGQLTAVRRTLRRKAEQTCGGPDLRSALDAGVVRLKQLKRGVASWRLGEEFDSIDPGLNKSYRRGRRALKRAADEGTAELFHSLRKRVKDRWYQARILESLWSGPEHSPEKTLRDLQEDLGDDHNLVVLRELVPAESAALLETIDGIQKHLRKKCLDIASGMYERKPRDFSGEMKDLWEAWRPALPAPKRAKAASARSARISSAA
jgi:CHAD domain-containing protein